MSGVILVGLVVLLVTYGLARLCVEVRRGQLELRGGAPGPLIPDGLQAEFDPFNDPDEQI